MDGYFLSCGYVSLGEKNVCYCVLEFIYKDLSGNGVFLLKFFFFEKGRRYRV